VKMFGLKSLSLSFLLILLVSVDGSASAVNKTIRMGYGMTYGTVFAGAINVAIENAQNDGLLRDYNFRYTLIFIFND